MEAFFEGIADYFLNFISQYSYFINLDYYECLFSKYFSEDGFIIGFVFVLLVYFSSAEEQKIAGFFKVLPIIAVINSCTVLTQLINTTFDQGLRYNGIESIINAPDNIISGFILTLVVSTYYKRFGGRAFLFGLATHTTMPMLNFSYIGYLNDETQIIQITVRVALAGFVCLIMSRRKYFFTSWIWYFVFHMLIRVTGFVLLFLNDRLYGKDVISDALEYFSRFTVDAIIFAVVLVFAIVFEKGVLAVSPARGTV